MESTDKILNTLFLLAHLFAVFCAPYFTMSIFRIFHSPCVKIVTIKYFLFILISFPFAVRHIGYLFILFSMRRFVMNLCYCVGMNY